jgi:hypothetical protein
MHDRTNHKLQGNAVESASSLECYARSSAVVEDFDDDRRPSRRRADDSSGSGNSGVKIFLLIFGSLACITVLACCGGGVWLYFKAQEVVQNVKDAVKDVALTNPDAIRRVTSEMTDISIPTEFVPEAGNSLFGTKFVLYNWCPTGTCDPSKGNLGSLTLLSIRLQGAGSKAELPDLTKTLSKEELAKSLKNFTKTEHEFDIRQQRCKFYVIQGEVISNPVANAGVNTEANANRNKPARDDDPLNPVPKMQFSVVAPVRVEDQRHVLRALDVDSTTLISKRSPEN